MPIGEPPYRGWADGVEPYLRFFAPEPMGNPISIKITRLTETAIIPTRGRDGDAAYDLYCDNEVVWVGHRTEAVGTGIAIEIPRGYCGLVLPRSGLSLRGIVVANAPGLIDSNYRGEVKVLLRDSQLPGVYEDHYRINRGDRIAQLLIQPVYDIQFLEVTNLSETERGSEGFGSSGK